MALISSEHDCESIDCTAVNVCNLGDNALRILNKKCEKEEGCEVTVQLKNLVKEHIGQGEFKKSMDGVVCSTK